MKMFFVIFISTEKKVERYIQIIGDENQTFQRRLNIAAFISPVIAQRDMQMLGEPMRRDISFFSDGIQTLGKQKHLQPSLISLDSDIMIHYNSF